MLFPLASAYTLGSLAFGSSFAQYFPPEPTAITKFQSLVHPGAKISYKKTSICETTPGVNSYSGYISLPPSDIFSHPINTFFLFFESRHSPSTAPLSIWIGGGPGESAITGATGENGPCYVNPDGNSTVLNSYSRNNYVNMLYIDQPVGAGYSYNRLVNGTIDQVTWEIIPTDFSKGLPFKPNNTLAVGTFSDERPRWTLNTSDTSAKIMWSFMQIWTQEFPEYKTTNSKISLWTNSYGGFFGSAVMAYFQSQNLKIASGKIPSCEGKILHLDTLGLENGCIDIEAQAFSYAQYPYNNTYGIQLITREVYSLANFEISGPGGCLELIAKCRKAATAGDPNDFGNNKTVDRICLQATNKCSPILDISEFYSNRSAFDISHFLPDPFPNAYPLGFFNQRWVQQELGVPVNFSYTPNVIEKDFFMGTGDPYRQSMAHLEYVLQNNIKVAMVYGDRDCRCNWIGAENVSLSVGYHDAAKFRSAGYENITTNATYGGGVVRQYNGFSFSRVFDAGHMVSSFQPATTYEIFMRAMFDTDIATGKVPTNIGLIDYISEGPASSFHIKNKLPPAPPTLCNVWAIAATCSDAQIAALEEGTAVVKNWIVVKPAA